MKAEAGLAQAGRVSYDFADFGRMKDVESLGGFSIAVAFKELNEPFCEKERVRVDLSDMLKLVKPPHFRQWRNTFFLAVARTISEFGGQINESDLRVPRWIDHGPKEPEAKFRFIIRWPPRTFRHRENHHVQQIKTAIIMVRDDMLSANKHVIPISRDDAI